MHSPASAYVCTYLPAYIHTHIPGRKLANRAAHACTVWLPRTYVLTYLDTYIPAYIHTYQDENWPTEPHMHPQSGFDVFSKKNIYSAPDIDKAATQPGATATATTGSPGNRKTPAPKAVKKRRGGHTSAAFQAYVDDVEVCVLFMSMRVFVFLH